MVRIGVVLVMGAIIGSMVVAMFAWMQYQPTALEVPHGEPVVVGPVEYAVTFEGTNAGVEGFRPQEVFVKIRVNMQNVAEQDAAVSGGQFHLGSSDMVRVQPVYGNGTLGEEDMLLVDLQPGGHVTRTTQFDVPFDDDATYYVYIRPAKEHGTTDYAVVCMTNC